MKKAYRLLWFTFVGFFVFLALLIWGGILAAWLGGGIAP